MCSIDFPFDTNVNHNFLLKFLSVFLFIDLQMHGYDTSGIPSMHHGNNNNNNNINHLQHPNNGLASDSIGHHPDSTDSYVTYLESDDSMQASP